MKPKIMRGVGQHQDGNCKYMDECHNKNSTIWGNGETACQYLLRHFLQKIVKWLQSVKIAGLLQFSTYGAGIYAHRALFAT